MISDKILVVGLDRFSRKIIDYLQKFDVEIFGFDFDVDKIEVFFNKKLIKNNSKTILEKLLKDVNYIILNVDFQKYKNIFKLSPFIPENCLIVDLTSCKNSFSNYKNVINGKNLNFLPCNFAFFPKIVVMNFDNNFKMNLLQMTTNFLSNFNLKISNLTIENNNLIFSKIFHIPYIFDKIFLNTHILNFLIENNDYTRIYQDIFYNRKNIVNDLEKIIQNFVSNSNKDIFEKILDEDVFLPKFKEKKIEISNSVFCKILLEKLMIKLFQYRFYKEYLDNLNLDYLKYDDEFLKEYYNKNKDDIEILFLLFKEKIENFIAFLNGENLTDEKIKKYLER